MRNRSHVFSFQFFNGSHCVSSRKRKKEKEEAMKLAPPWAKSTFQTTTPRMHLTLRYTLVAAGFQLSW